MIGMLRGDIMSKFTKEELRREVSDWSEEEVAKKCHMLWTNAYKACYDKNVKCPYDFGKMLHLLHQESIKYNVNPDAEYDETKKNNYIDLYVESFHKGHLLVYAGISSPFDDTSNQYGYIADVFFDEMSAPPNFINAAEKYADPDVDTYDV